MDLFYSGGGEGEMLPVAADGCNCVLIRNTKAVSLAGVVD